jgi:hypothetical protein
MIWKGMYFNERRVIGENYLIRHILFECSLFGIYVHHFLSSDNDRALHDHPWNFISVVLSGAYVEIHGIDCNGYLTAWDGDLLTKSKYRRAGSIAYRPATWRHRVVLKTPEVWTLMVVSGRKRRWGFYPKGKWCWWRKYNTQTGICENEVIYNFGKD